MLASASVLVVYSFASFSDSSSEFMYSIIVWVLVVTLLGSLLELTKPVTLMLVDDTCVRSAMQQLNEWLTAKVS